MNTYNVPAKLWNKFSPEAKAVYNAVMKQSIANQITTTPTRMEMLPHDAWETICHNFACYAAFAIDGKALKKGDIVLDEDKNGRTKRVRQIA